ncbi:MAG: hypothetical protein Q8O63_03475 [Hoeflea sp.]|nr:hypothetical protein [Hoeflea sp.]
MPSRLYRLGLLPWKERGCGMSGLLRGLIVAVVVVVVLAAGSLAWLNWRVNRETVTPLQKLNSGGTAGRALAILSPGLSAFPTDVMTAFEEGLIEKGWRIDHTTASSQATAHFPDYDLIVLTSPIYSGRVAPPLLAYIARSGDFGGKKVAVLLTAGGAPDDPISSTEALLAEHGAQLTAIHGYAVYQPNDPENKYQGSNTERAVQMARDAGRALADSLQ